jgi:hypothetical protein
MGCSSCQQNNHVVPSTHVHNPTAQVNCECACGCEEPVCPTPQPCTEITDSKCIIYTDAAIKCGNDTVVTQNASVSTALNQIVSYFCGQLGLVTTADIVCNTVVIVPAGSSMQEAFEAVVNFICNIQLTPGPEGPQGIEGPQGPIGLTGPTPWTLPATVYDNGFAYPLGAAVTFQGGYYYRTGNPLNPGYPPTPGSISPSWTPVADAGAQGPQGPVGPPGPAGPSGSSGLYAQIRDSVAVTNATGTGSLIGTGVGTLSVPANTFQIGDSFKGTLTGDITCANNQSLKITLLANGITLAASPSMIIPQTTDKHWSLDIDFTIRGIGGPGVANIMTGAKFIYNKDSNNIFEGREFNASESTLFDTTVLNTLQIQAEWGSVNAVNSIHSDIFTLFKTF